MKRILYVPLLLGTLIVSQLMGQAGKPKTAKPAPKPANVSFPAGKKYPSLLWEISGNGLKRSSWLFGTMHVSNKLAFKLGDSFYNAIRSVDVVALETNPETWQDDYSRSAEYRGAYSSDPDLMPSRFRYNNFAIPGQTMSITSFAIDSYEELARASLAIEPSLINGMLYRTYGAATNDFEENTFLDMHIFQVGRKLGKRVSGVENFEESEKLVAEAYHDASKDKNKKKKSYNYDGAFQNPKRLEDAYRDGDLDLLDSIEMQNVQSDAFQEKFMFKRNEIQANSIDSIIRKASLFVGVGAAHLPGKRGVIELLRKMGYTVRPVFMGTRSSAQKEQFEKMRVAHNFQQQTSADGFFKVAIPGKKFYEFSGSGGFNIVQYADLVNGAYYLVTRVKTNSSVWGDDLARTAEKIDAGLYENIPGKIIKKTAVTKNGYPGFDVTTRTRRGDLQRYQIFVTPFEMIFFKMSGNGDYVGNGTDAAKFFNSVSLKEYIPTAELTSWQPPSGGFSVLMPHTPSMLKDEMWGNSRIEYAAIDKNNGNSYLVMKGNLQNYETFAEDSFELNLMDASYQYAGFIEKQTSRKLGSYKGYPILDASYRHKDGSHSTTRFLIQGPNYYVVLARYKHENPAVKKFIESFSITPNIYPAATLQTDTDMRFSVKSPVPLNRSDSAGAAMRAFLQNLKKDEEDESEKDAPTFKSGIIGNDTLGEKVFITWSQLSRKSYSKDSLALSKLIFGEGWNEDSTLIYRSSTSKQLPNGTRQYDFAVSDTGSSRMLVSRILYKDGHVFSFSSLTDTVSKRSALLDNFFSSFAPVDTLKASPLLNKQSVEYVNELFSKDSVIARRGAKQLFQSEFDSTDVPLLKRSIEAMNWNVRNYIANKQYFISSLGDLKDPSITGFLTNLYFKVKDTSDLQRTILEALLNQKTTASFKAFTNLILQEPPILDGRSDNTRYKFKENFVVRDVELEEIRTGIAYAASDFSGAGTWNQLYDSLALTRTMFPDMLQFLNIDDFKSETLDLMHVLIDSGYLKGADYESQLSKLYLDGRMQLKKQIAKESKLKMEKVARKDLSTLYSNNITDEDTETDDLEFGNPAVDQYSVLLLPFRDKHQGIQNYFNQLMTTADNRLLYNSFILLLRNNQPVPDSLFTKFASSDKYRSELYGDLQKLKKLDKFPAAEKKQELLVRSALLRQLGSYDKPDTLVYLDALPVSYKKQKGLLYFYKYKKMRDDDSWALATWGIQPASKDSFTVGRSAFTQTSGRMLGNDKPVAEQLEKVKNEMIITMNPIAENFYDARQYANYKNMLAEIVKRRRFQD